MPISTINRIKTVATKISPIDDSITTIYENVGLTVGDMLIPEHKIVSFNCFIKNLRAFALIESLAEVALPNFTLDDSETDKLYKTLATEWQGARKQLTLYISNESYTNNQTGEGWSKVGSISLLNPSGYPYRIYNLMDIYTDSLALELGDNGKIGVQIEDVGYGLLSIGDELTIHGSYIEEIFVQSPEPSYVSIINNNNSGEEPIDSPPTPTPPYVFAPVFRVSANELQLSDDDLVESWLQIGSSETTVAQYSVENQPTFFSNILNGKSVVYFDANKFLNVNPPSNFSSSVMLIPSIGDWAIFVVGDLVDSGYAMMNYSYTDPSHKGFIGLSYYAADIGIWSESLGRENYTLYCDRENYNIYTIRRKNNLITISANGIQYDSKTLAIPLTYESTFLARAVIGRNYINDNFLTGYIADIAILNNHTDLDINEIGNFYKNFYNLDWANI